MPLEIGPSDVLEMQYMAQFKSFAAKYGVGIDYSADRLALDWGLHLTQIIGGGSSPTQTRVWFQFKGIQATTLSADQANKSVDFAVALRLEHVRHWYGGQEAIYIAVYVEALDAFFAQDIAQIVAQLGGEAVLSSPQDTVTVRFPKDTQIDDAFWKRLRNHRSMRTDIATYRGVPLAHQRNVRSSILKQLEPATFIELIDTLLAYHRYRANEAIDMTQLYPHSQDAGDIITGSYGILYDPYEWSPQLFNGLGVSEDGLYTEGETLRSHGRCAVIVHSRPQSRPDGPALCAFMDGLSQRKISTVLVFANHHIYMHESGTPYNAFPEYSQAILRTGVECMPQHLEDLARTVLIRAQVYAKFEDRLEFWGDDLIRGVRAGTLRIVR